MFPRGIETRVSRLLFSHQSSRRRRNSHKTVPWFLAERRRSRTPGLHATVSGGSSLGAEQHSHPT